MKDLSKPSDAVAKPPQTVQFFKGNVGFEPLLQSGAYVVSTPIKETAAKAGKSSRKLGRILPHEWIFGTFLLLTGLRLFLHGGAAQKWSLLFLGCLAVGIGIFFWAEQNLTPWRWRVRLLFYPVAMGLSFYAMGVAIPLLGIPQVDGLLLQWDRDLLGETPAIAWEPFLRPWLEDLAMAGYLFFFYYLIGGPGHYCIHNLRLFRKCIVGLFTMYGLAFMGYTVLPAAGPHIYLTFNTPLHGPWLLDWTIKTVNQASNGLDVFPSVHLAATLYLLLFDWRHWRRRFWLFLLPCLLLWFSTMYLRFHYFVDLAAAVVLALASWYMAEMYDASADDLPVRAQRKNRLAFFTRLFKRTAKKRKVFGFKPTS